MDTKKLLSASDVARLLGIQKRSVYKMSRAGQIPGRLKIHPKMLRFDAAEIERWLHKCVCEPVNWEDGK